MRYESHHKEQTHRRIVESASRKFRAEGINGPGVATVMKASGLTVGGFYKHFTSKDALFAEAIDDSVRQVAAMLTDWSKQAPRGGFWREIVKKYLSIEHCEDPAMGCPIAALAPDIARTRPAIKRKIRDSIERYKQQLVEFMPGANLGEQQRNFALIFTAMVGALAVARTMSDKEEKERLLGLVRNHLLASF
jgi:TetR/AcrR family transcriptional regulator, transcriptional repressor for nem operon